MAHIEAENLPPLGVAPFFETPAQDRAGQGLLVVNAGTHQLADVAERQPMEFAGQLAEERRGHAKEHLVAGIVEVVTPDQGFLRIGMGAQGASGLKVCCFCVSYWSGRAFGSRHGNRDIVRQSFRMASKPAVLVNFAGDS